MVPLKVGDLVRTTRDAMSTDWNDNHQARARPWQAIGHVVEVFTGHGLCYAVRLNVGAAGYYEHGELEFIGDDA